MKNENELLLHIYKTSDMGIKTLTKLLTILKEKDNKIKKEIESELKEYECTYKSSKKILDKQGIKKIGTNILTSITANTAMNAEIDKDNSDAKIADILIRGYTMGILEMERKVKSYKDSTDMSVLRLGKKLLNFQKECVKLLEPYL